MGVLTVVFIAIASAPGVAAGDTSLRCNGSVRLCGVSIGDVVFATSHNSMSTATDGFLGPNQDLTIPEQLRAGIRGFQIDAYEGVPRSGRVYTELAGPFASQATDLPAPLVTTAVRIHERIGAPPAGTPTTVYLCHSFCEIGAVELATSARQLRRFLEAHPREMVMVVIEDYVAPERLHDEFVAAGLGDRLVSVEPGASLPTLGAALAAGRQLLVSLENGDGGPAMPNAFTSLVQETPFTFLTTSSLRGPASCAPNRGVAGAPVFQFNHWVTPAGARRSSVVNHRQLRTRVAECTAVRGRAPTLVAVDFVGDSDVVAVTRSLNAREAPR